MTAPMPAPPWPCPAVVTRAPCFDPAGTERPCPYVGTADEVSRHLWVEHGYRRDEVAAWRRDEGVGEADEG